MISREQQSIALWLFIGSVAFVCWLLWGPLTSQTSNPLPPQPVPARCMPKLAWYVPPPSLFGFTDVYAIIHSYYGDEYNLINDYPVDDIDYMLDTRYATSRPIYLPGGRYDHYAYLGAAYIPGSGWYSEWQAPNGGRFAFLHVLSIPVGITRASVSVVARPGRFSAVRRPTLPAGCSDGTAHALSTIRRYLAPRPGTSTFVGGQLVGYSGWPTSSIYGNGSYGPADSHMCLVVSSLAVSWFYEVATGQDRPKPRPKPRPRPHLAFPVSRWNRAVIAHNHVRLSRPWHTVPYRLHGHIAHIAYAWAFRNRGRIDHACGGVTSPQHWDRRHRVMVQRFRHGSGYQWSSRGTPVRFSCR